MKAYIIVDASYGDRVRAPRGGQARDATSHQIYMHGRKLHLGNDPVVFGSLFPGNPLGLLFVFLDRLGIR